MFEDSIYSQFIYKSRYSRWIEKEKRREEWPETIHRYMEFIDKHLQSDHNYTMPLELKKELYDAIFTHNVMPSMRALMSAGKAAERNHIAVYNCSYAPMEDMKNFDETLAISMSSTGCGYTVENRYIEQLPEMPEEFFNSETIIVFHDSRIGWAKGFREFISLLLIGQIPQYDISNLRPSGARLKIMGGRSSGPQPLIELLEYTKNIFVKAAGRKLTSLECHDLECMIGDIVVQGGVRRCLGKSERIQTDNGYKEISNIEIGDNIICKGISFPVVEKVYSGKQKVFKITHKFGTLDEVTKNHEVAVFDSMNSYSFKSIENLKIGDTLVWDGFGIKGNKQSLPKFIENNHFNTKSDIIFPEYLNEEIAWLIGLIQGDGYIHKGGLEISGNISDYNMLDIANDLFKKYFNIQGSLKEDSKKGNGIRLRLFSSSLANWFYTFIKKPNEDIRIPSFIFGAEDSVRLSYLMGIFDADGRITPNGGIDQCTTVYSSFKKDQITLLASLGIGSRIYFKSNEKRRNKGVKAKDYYTIRIVGRLNRDKWLKGICFSKSIKHSLINEYKGKHNDFSWPKDFFHNNKWKGDMSYSKSVELGLCNLFNLYPSKIISIDYAGETETYDIEIGKIKQFTVNGLIVHNSALISLSDLLDDRMRTAKSGNWYDTHPHRRLANNSAVYNEKPEIGVFMREWLSLYESKSGERGIFSRPAIRKVIENSNEFRKKLGAYIPQEDDPPNVFSGVRYRDINHLFGTNPCSEIILRPYEFCNLTEVVIYEDDTPETIKNKVRIATILGTFQSCFTNFKYINKKWQKNCEDERLLGVSLNGIMDNKYTNGKQFENHTCTLEDFLQELKTEAIKTNIQFAKLLDINSSVAITCVKPSGTSSALNGTSSGIHPAHSPYYIRYVRNDIKDPLTNFMIDKGFPFEKDVYDPSNVVCFKFPIKSANNAICKKDLTAIEHLELWKKYQMYWCEHKPSITISVKEKEWLKVGSWIFENFEWVSGISFLPAEENSTVYRQAPFTECNEVTYKDLLSKMPKSIDWSGLKEYEIEDTTVASQELACTSGGCNF